MNNRSTKGNVTAMENNACPVCLTEYTEENRAVNVRGTMVRRSPKHAWKHGPRGMVCQTCATTIAAGRDGAENTVMVSIGTTLDGHEKATCEHCGLPFLVRPVARRKHVACSARCRSALHRADKAVPEAVTRTCDGCGTEMTGRADRRYCSPACKQRAYRNRNGSTVTTSGTFVDPEVPRAAPKDRRNRDAFRLDRVADVLNAQVAVVDTLRWPWDGLDDSVTPEVAREALPRMHEGMASLNALLVAVEARANR